MPQHDVYIVFVRSDRESNDSEFIANEDVRDEYSQRGTLGMRVKRMAELFE
jgi:hypothetical protein